MRRRHAADQRVTARAPFQGPTSVFPQPPAGIASASVNSLTGLLYAVANTSSVTLLPTGVIALRAAAGLAREWFVRHLMLNGGSA